MPSDTVAAPGARAIFRLQFDQDYDTFLRDGRIASTLSAIAKILDIEPSDISLRSVSSGSTVMVISLPDEEADKLTQYFDERQNVSGFVTHIEGLSNKQIEVLNSNPRASRIYATDDIDSDPRAAIEFTSDLSWLHISDLHIKDDYVNVLSNTATELQRFLDYLPECLRNAGITPDAIFFTGDVAAFGSPTQYEAAELFFARLKNSLPKPSNKAPFVVVPGNHDVSWGDIDFETEKKLRKQLSPEHGKEFSPDDFAKVITEHDSYISKRRANYVAFAKKFNGKSCDWLENDVFSRSFTAGSRPLKIGVGGFNSAWLSTRRDLLKPDGVDESLHPSLDLESLALGTGQIRKIKKALNDSKAEVRIALVHHSPESGWYRGYDNEVQLKEFTDFDFVLRGHQHEPEAREGRLVGGKHGYLELAPGALWTWPERFEGFMTAELDFSAQFIRLTAWKPTSARAKWDLDPDFGNGGVDYRLLPTNLLNRLKSKGHKVLT